MNKQQFKAQQPIVYRILSNALKQDRLAHAYLFAGPKGAPKEECAILFAQSMVCSHCDADGFACQECDVCHRIAQEEAFDFYWIHGEKERIKKKDILDLQSFFSKTSQEVSNRRVYFLENFDNATPDAQNSLLKFLEEPQPGIYAILSADEKSNILPTILSRVQNIPFRPVQKSQVIEFFREKMPEEDAQMFVHFGYNEQRAIQWIENEDYPLIKDSAKKFVSECISMETIFYMQREVFLAKNERLNKDNVRLWLEWLVYSLKQESTLDQKKKIEIQSIVVEAMNLLVRPIDLALFLDKIYYQIRKVVKS